MWSPEPAVFGAGLAFSALFVWYTRRRKALSTGGALAAAAVGLWVLWWAGPRWLLPLFFFFVSGTLLGRRTNGRSSAVDTKHGQPRDAWQVLCNGGIYAVLSTLIRVWPASDIPETLMALSLAVSTSDTWSSEIGQYFRQKTVDILRWKPVPPGLSGGVSGAGTLGGLAGAAAMALLCSILMYDGLEPKFVLDITAGGFAGMLSDSLLGAGLQARYQNEPGGAWSDQAGPAGRLYSGLRWMTNDAVNFWSNALTTLAGYWFFQ